MSVEYEHVEEVKKEHQKHEKWSGKIVAMLL